jgi:hypothetical protein
MLLALLLQVALEKLKDRVEIKVDDEVVGSYVFDDPVIRRPYLANLRVPGGPQVTRHHPPRDADAKDHATMHPGIWLSFGDLGGGDFWRNKGKVEALSLDLEKSGFKARFRYEGICEESARITFLRAPNGLLIVYDSAFRSDRPFAFGDQEEMGFGVRLATPLAVKNGGRMTDSAGRVNEKGIWGKTADWVDLGGVLVVPDPANFRPSWMHARDYGLLVCNPFGRKAFTKGEPSRVEVKPGDTFRLRYAALLYQGDAKADPVLDAMRELPRP